MSAYRTLPAAPTPTTLAWHVTWTGRGLLAAIAAQGVTTGHHIVYALLRGDSDDIFSAALNAVMLAITVAYVLLKARLAPWKLRRIDDAANAAIAEFDRMEVEEYDSKKMC